jgi:hypothetical protein
MVFHSTLTTPAPEATPQPTETSAVVGSSEGVFTLYTQFTVQYSHSTQFIVYYSLSTQFTVQYSVPTLSIHRLPFT